MNAKRVTCFILASTGLLSIGLQSALADDTPITSMCVAKRTGKVRIVDNLRQSTCRASELTFRSGYKVYDADGKPLGFSALTENNPYSTEIYIPLQRAKLSISPKQDASQPNGINLNQGDIEQLSKRTSYYQAKDCEGFAYHDYFQAPNSGAEFSTIGKIRKDPGSQSAVQFSGPIFTINAISYKTEVWNTTTGWTGDTACTNYPGSSGGQRLVPVISDPFTIVLPFSLPVNLPLQFK